MKRQVVRQGIAEQQRKDHYPGRNPHRTKQSLQVNIHAEQLAVIVQRPGMDDHLRRRNRPEAVTKKKRVRNEQKHRYPQQRRNRNCGSVGAGKHKLKPSQKRRARAPAPHLQIPDSRTGTASAGENSSSTSPCQSSRLAVRIDSASPSGTLNLQQFSRAVKCLVHDFAAKSYRRTGAARLQPAERSRDAVRKVPGHRAIRFAR